MSDKKLSEEGYERLKEALGGVTSPNREGISQAIAEAREQDDLKENAGYDAAREQQEFMNQRIAEVEGKLSGSGGKIDSSTEEDTNQSPDDNTSENPSAAEEASPDDTESGAADGE